MKKIFTLCAAAIAALGFRASAFEMYFGDTPVVDGQTYETGYTVEEIDYGGFTMYNVKQNSNIYFRGNVGDPMSVTVELLTKDGVSLGVCSIDRQCQMLPTPKGVYALTKSGALSEAVSDAQIHIETTFMNADFSSLKPAEATVQAVSGAYSAKVTVKFTTVPASVKGIEALDYVKPAGGNILNYSVAAPATLTLYSITGSQAGKYNLNGAGSLNLSNLPKGVYIYTAGSHKGKLVIR